MKRLRWPLGRNWSIAVSAVLGVSIVVAAVTFAPMFQAPKKTALASLLQGIGSSAPPTAKPSGGRGPITQPGASPSAGRQASPSAGARPAGSGASPSPSHGANATPSASASSSPSPSGGEGGGHPTPSPTSTSTPTSTPTSMPTPTPTLPPASGSYPRVGINVEPSIRPTRYTGANPDGWWCVGASGCHGVSDGTAFVNQEMPMVAALGVQTLRVEFPWGLIETSKGVYNWSRADYIVNSANANHVTLQPVIVFTPLWESVGFSGPPPAADFAAFVAAIVNRYKGSIHYWEMWNEPDLSSYFNGTESQYVSQVLVPGYQAAHGADSGTHVILGAPSYANTGWLNSIYSLGGGGAFDIIAFHDYATSGGAVIGDAGSVEGVLQAHGQSGKPLWLGEYGFQDNTTADANQQALMTSVLTGSSSIAMAEWYNLRDDFSMTSPTTVYKAAYWGLATSSYQLKNGYGTMQNLIRQGY